MNVWEWNQVTDKSDNKSKSAEVVMNNGFNLWAGKDSDGEITFQLPFVRPELTPSSDFDSIIDMCSPLKYYVAANPTHTGIAQFDDPD